MQPPHPCGARWSDIGSGPQNMIHRCLGLNGPGNPLIFHSFHFSPSVHHIFPEVFFSKRMGLFVRITLGLQISAKVRPNGGQILGNRPNYKLKNLGPNPLPDPNPLMMVPMRTSTRWKQPKFPWLKSVYESHLSDAVGGGGG